MPDSDSGERRRVLFISPEAPYPLEGGGALRTASLLEYFARDANVDLLVFAHPGQSVIEKIPHGLVRRAAAIELIPHSKATPARAVRNLPRLALLRPPLFDRFSGYEAAIAAFTGKRHYDLAVLEHFWSLSYLPLVRQHVGAVVLDLHNVESEWHRSCAAASSNAHAAVHRVFGMAARRWERRYFPQCDWILTTSDRDADRVRATAPAVSICIYPNAIRSRPPLPDALRANGESEIIAFSGNMEYEPNRTGLIWFFDQVWPRLKVRFPELRIELIGKNAHALPARIRETQGVVCSGWIPDPFVHLARAQICVVPLRSGSGTRLKIVEAWAARRAVVSTSIGAEGLDAYDGVSIVLADSPATFANSVTHLLNDAGLRQKIANGGRKLFEQKYTWEMVWQGLDQCFLYRKS